MYLFEKDLIAPLNQHLKSKDMSLVPVQSKCGGLQVLTPAINSLPEQDDDGVFYLNEAIVAQIYNLYRDYVNNFGPTLNSS